MLFFLFIFINFLNSNSNYFEHIIEFLIEIELYLQFIVTIEGFKYFSHYKNKFFRVNDCNNNKSMVSNYDFTLRYYHKIFRYVARQ